MHLRVNATAKRKYQKAAKIAGKTMADWVLDALDSAVKKSK